MRRKGCRNASILAVLVGAVVLVSGCVSEYTKFPWASNDQTGTEDLGGDWAEGDGRLDALDLVDDPRIPDVPPDAPDVEDVWELLDVPDTLDVPDVPDVPDVEDVDGWEQIDPWCGDGTCDEGENCESCADDCGPCCGNGLCDHEETACACPADCGDPCEGRECGDDGCGGVCGLCGDGLFCSEGFLCLMEDGPTTCAELDACFRDCEEGDAVCAQLCRKSAPAPALVLWDDLVLCAEAECVLDPAEECIEAALLGPCVTEYEACFEICVPKCHGRECGSDLCGANCGYCQPFFVCEEGTCVADPGCGDAVCGAEETCDTCPLDCGECCGDGLCDLLLETCATCGLRMCPVR